MRFRTVLQGFSIALLGIGLAACGGAAAPADALPLTQTFQSSDGSLSLSYPAGWVAQATVEQVTLANSQDALTAQVPAPGQFQARLFAAPISAIPGLPADATPLTVLQIFAEQLSTSGVIFNQTSELTIGGRPAARVEGTGTDGQAVLLAVNLGDGNYVFATAASAPGEIGRFEPTLHAILGSLTYTAPTIPVPESTP